MGSWHPVWFSSFGRHVVCSYQKWLCENEGSISALPDQPGKWGVNANSHLLCCIFSGERRCISIFQHCPRVFSNQGCGFPLWFPGHPEFGPICIISRLHFPKMRPAQYMDYLKKFMLRMFCVQIYFNMLPFQFIFNVVNFKVIKKKKFRLGKNHNFVNPFKLKLSSISWILLHQLDSTISVTNDSAP